MGDSPKTLSDVKVLLEEAVQVVSDLETESLAEGKVAEAANEPPQTDNVTTGDTPLETKSDNPTPPTA